MKTVWILSAMALLVAGACGGKSEPAKANTATKGADKAKAGPPKMLTAEEIHDVGLPGDAKAGEAVYKRVCSSCHQPDGSGMNGALAANFRGDPQRLNKPDSVLLRSIAEGYKGTKLEMPPQNAATNEQERKDALAYVRWRFGQVFGGKKPQ